MQGVHNNVKAKNTKKKPAILLSIPLIIFPKSNPHVIQKSEEDGAGVSDTNDAFLMEVELDIIHKEEKLVTKPIHK
jgi:hypothetical protein